MFCHDDGLRCQLRQCGNRLQSLKTHGSAFKCADYSSHLLSFLLSPFSLICDIHTYTPVLCAAQLKCSASVVVIVGTVFFEMAAQ